MKSPLRPSGSGPFRSLGPKLRNQVTTCLGQLFKKKFRSYPYPFRSNANSPLKMQSRSGILLNFPDDPIRSNIVFYSGKRCCRTFPLCIGIFSREKKTRGAHIFVFGRKKTNFSIDTNEIRNFRFFFFFIFFGRTKWYLVVEF